MFHAFFPLSHYRGVYLQQCVFFLTDRSQDLFAIVSPIKSASYDNARLENRTIDMILTNHTHLWFSKQKAELLDVEFVATLAKF